MFFLSERAIHVGGGCTRDVALAGRALMVLMGHWTFHGFGPFVMESKATGAAIGSAGPWFPPGWPEHELTWTLWSDSVEGQGYAAEAAIAVRAHVFNDLGWTRAVSYIAPDNRRSIALAERLGCAEDSSLPAPNGEPARVFVHPRG